MRPGHRPPRLALHTGAQATATGTIAAIFPEVPGGGTGPGRAREVRLNEYLLEKPVTE